MKNHKRAKPALPRAPLPRQTGGAHGARNEGQEKRLLERIAERLNDEQEDCDTCSLDAHYERGL